MLLNQASVKTALNSAASKEAVKRVADTYSGIEGFSTIPERRFAERRRRSITCGETSAAQSELDYTPGAVTAVKPHHGIGAATDFLTHSALSGGPTKLLAKFEAGAGIESLHVADLAAADRMMAINGHLADRWSSSVAVLRRRRQALFRPISVDWAKWAALGGVKQWIDSTG